MKTAREIAKQTIRSEGGALNPLASAAMLGFTGDLEDLLIEAIEADRAQRG